jgi:cyclopropane-fatty-acyl-phospholipid synthase
MDTRAAVQAVFSGPDRPFGVRLWDGTVLPPVPANGAPVLVLTDPRAGSAFGIPPSEERLSEAFLAGDIEVEGNLVDFLELASAWKGPQHLPTAAVATGLVAEVGARATEFFRAAGKHSVERDAGAVRSHYDMGNDFYRLFLDRKMVYSCAYWAPGVETLEAAQTAKLELVCRKLGLRRGQRFLDIGCGWGALVSHATAAFGVQSTGITLSPPQRELAVEALRVVSAPGLAPDIRLTDYRKLPADERWDAVGSVGMMEHVGRDQLGRYFSVLAAHLPPGGLLLNHAIAENGDPERTIPWLHRSHGGFIQQEIFPDSDLPPLQRVVDAAQHAGFEVLDVETMRAHYERTLVEWLRRLDSNFVQALAMVGERRARAWRLYLASSAVTFRVGRITVAQVLLRKKARGALPSIVDRGAWYRGLDRL